MPLEFRDYIQSFPGFEQNNAVQAFLAVDEGEGMWGRAPARPFAWFEGATPLLFMGGFNPYVAGEYTVTGDNSSTVARIANGVRFQTDATATDNDDISVLGLNTWALAQDKWFGLLACLKVSSAANLGFNLALLTSNVVETYTAEPADGIILRKAKNAATPVEGIISENGNAITSNKQTLNQDSSGTDLTVADGTEVILGFLGKAGASAGQSQGAFYTKVSAFSDRRGLAHPFTAAQQTALRAMLATTAPTLAALLGFRVNSTTQRNGVVRWAYAFGEL